MAIDFNPHAYRGLIIAFIQRAKREETEVTSTCSTCGHEPEKRNNSRAECSHPDCPHRRTAMDVSGGVGCTSETPMMRIADCSVPLFDEKEE